MLQKRAPAGCAWWAGMVLATAAVAACLRAWSFDARALGPWAALAAPGLILLAWSHFAHRPDASLRWAFTAGFAGGILAGIAAAQVAPTKWTMTDIAWHAAKVDGASRGQALADPLLNLPTIYPFVFHWLLGIPVKLGASVRTVLWAATPLSLALLLAAYRWCVASWCTPVRAACASIALPLAFYCPLEGFILLPNPFNASLPAVFLGLGLLTRGSSSGRAPSLIGAGCSFGLAGVLWYGHLPWVALTVVACSVPNIRRLAWIALGALPWAALLVIHFVILSTQHMLGATAFNASTLRGTLEERLLGLGRNMLTLSGEAGLDQAIVWVGGLMLLALAISALRGFDPATRAPGTIGWALVGLSLSLVWAAAKVSFPQPMTWRYGFLFYALVLALLAGARPWWSSRWNIGPIQLLAALAVAWGPCCLLPRVNESRRLAGRFEETGAAVAAYLDAQTRRNDPVFASFDTWDLAIAVGAPRPSLVARNGGLHNFAPAEVVRPRWDAYARAAEADDAHAVREILRPFGFKLAVISQRDRERPGFRALADGFAIVFQNEEYVIVDLERPR